MAPFGLSGEMKVRLETDFPDRFARLKQVCLRAPNGAAELYSITGARPHKGQVLLKLAGVASIDDAELLRNYTVQIRSSDVIRLPANEFYIHDLIGCDVVTEAGRSLGHVTSVLRGAANDVYVVTQDKRELLLPAIREVIKQVDIRERMIVAAPTPGLIPDDADPSCE